MGRVTVQRQLLVIGALVLATACSAGTPPGSPRVAAHRRNLDPGLWSPLQAACEILGRSEGACTVTTVPAGHRLVIETVSGRLGRFRGGDPIPGPVIQTTVSAVAQRHWLTREFIGTSTTLNLDLYVVTHHLRLYADPGTPVLIEAPEAVGSFTISGFLVKLP